MPHSRGWGSFTPYSLLFSVFLIAVCIPLSARSVHTSEQVELSPFDRFLQVQKQRADGSGARVFSKLSLDPDARGHAPTREPNPPGTSNRSSRRHDAQISSSQRKVYNRIKKLNTDTLRKQASAKENNADDVYANQPLPPVSFSPKELSFGSQSLCTPASLPVTIINHSPIDELHILSASTDETHWRVGTFVPMSIPPRSQGTIWMLFLPRVLGNTAGTLVLQTNVGGFIYSLSGQGVESPYKVAPFAGAMIPVGVNYGPPLNIFNYHDEELVVKEVFSNEPFLGVTFDSDTTSSSSPPMDPWHVAAGQRATIGTLSFISDTPGRFSGSIMVKTNKGDLIIPFEVWVLKGGIHRTPEEINFGVLTSPTERHSVPITLLNSGPQHILLVDMYASTADPQLHLNFKKRQQLQPYVDTHVATAVYTGRSEGVFKGKLVLRTNDSNPVNSRLEIPYYARVLHGSLGYSTQATSFPITEALTKTTRTLEVSNKFSVPLTFFTARIDDPCFTVENFVRGTVIRPGETVDLVTLSFQPNTTHQLYDVDLVLQTNASALTIPLHVYHGRLRWSVIDHSIAMPNNSTEINFGILGVNENRMLKLNVSNENPVKVQVNSFTTTHPELLTVKLDSVWNKKGSLALSSQELSSLVSRAKRSTGGSEALVTLDPGHKVVFTVELSTPREEKGKDVLIEIETSFEKSMQLPVAYQSVHGSLKFNTTYIRFEPSFSGRVLRKTISAVSTYSRPLEVFSVASSDPRVVVEFLNKELYPGKETVIGHVAFDASKGNVDENFMHNREPQGLSKPGDTFSSGDISSYLRREAVWRKLESRDATAFRASITFNTDVVQGYSLTIRGSVAQPSLVKVKQVQFGLTQVGSASDALITVVNPSDVYIHVELLPHNPELSAKLKTDGDDSSPEAFSIAKGATVVAVIPPHEDAQLGPVVFRPTDLGDFSVTLLLKNNLTLFSPQPVSGRGGSGVLVVLQENNPVHKFLVNVTAEELGYRANGTKGEKDDGQGAWDPVADVVSVRRFVLSNEGDLPLKVHSTSVGGLQCGGLGFHIEPCRDFSLLNGATTNFTITYRPDFASSQVMHSLVFRTSSGDVSFAIEARLPHHLLPLWIEAQPLSPVEELARAVAVGAAAILIIVVIYVFFSDTDKRRLAKGTDRSATAESEASKHADSSRASPAMSLTSVSESGVSHDASSSETSTTPEKADKKAAKKKAKRERQKAKAAAAAAATASAEVVERVSSSSSRSAVSISKSSSTMPSGFGRAMPGDIAEAAAVEKAPEPMAPAKTGKASRKTSGAAATKAAAKEAQNTQPTPAATTSTVTKKEMKKASVTPATTQEPVAPPPGLASQRKESAAARQGAETGAKAADSNNTTGNNRHRSGSKTSDDGSNKGPSRRPSLDNAEADTKKSRRAKKKKEKQNAQSTTALVTGTTNNNANTNKSTASATTADHGSKFNKQATAAGAAGPTSGGRASKEYKDNSKGASTTSTSTNANSQQTSLMAAAATAAARQQNANSGKGSGSSTSSANHTGNQVTARGGKAERGGRANTRGGRANRDERGAGNTGRGGHASTRGGGVKHQHQQRGGYSNGGFGGSDQTAPLGRPPRGGSDRRNGHQQQQHHQGGRGRDQGNSSRNHQQVANASGNDGSYTNRSYTSYSNDSLSSHASSHQPALDPWARAAETQPTPSTQYPYVPPNQHARPTATAANNGGGSGGAGDHGGNNFLFGSSPFTTTPLFTAVPPSTGSGAAAGGAGAGPGSSLFSSSPFFTHPTDGPYNATTHSDNKPGGNGGGGSGDAGAHDDRTASLFQTFGQFAPYNE